MLALFSSLEWPKFGKITGKIIAAPFFYLECNKKVICNINCNAVSHDKWYTLNRYVNDSHNVTDWNRLIELTGKRFAVWVDINLVNISTGNTMFVASVRCKLGNNTLPVGTNSTITWTAWIWWWINTSGRVYKVISMSLKKKTASSLWIIYCFSTNITDIWLTNNIPQQLRPHLKLFLSHEWVSSCLTSISIHNRSFQGWSFQAINCTGTDNIK